MSNAAEASAVPNKSTSSVITQLAAFVTESAQGDTNPDMMRAFFTLEVLGTFDDTASFDIAESIQQAAFIIASQDGFSVDKVTLRYMLNKYAFDSLDEHTVVLRSTSIDVTDEDGIFNWKRRFDMPFARVRQGNFRELEASPNMLSTELNVATGRGMVRWYQREALKFFTNKTPVLKNLHSRCSVNITGQAFFALKEEQPYLKDYLGAPTNEEPGRYYYEPLAVQQLGAPKPLLTKSALVNLYDPTGSLMVESIRAHDAWKVAHHLNRANHPS